MTGLGNDAAVRKLLDAKADITTRDKMDRTAEEYAMQKRQNVCARAIRDAVQRAQQADIEVELAQTSPFAPFVKEGDQTSPNSKGLSEVVYHQVQWLIFKGYVHAYDMTEKVMGLLRSTEACLALSALKDFEERCDRRENVRSLESELSNELDRFRKLQGIWEGLQRGRPFGFIRADNGRRVWCHERQVKDDEITEGMRVCFEIQMGRSGKEEAGMVQAAHSVGRRNNKRSALFATRGADYSGQQGSGKQGPIAPKLLMMTHDEAFVMRDMGGVTQQNIATPHLDKIYILPGRDQGLPCIDVLFATPGYEITKARQCSQELNGIKSQLDDIDMGAWRPHTRKTLLTNPDIIQKVRGNCKPEMCTRAFLKMYEMLSAYDLVQPPDPTKFNSLHLCEAPGDMPVVFGRTNELCFLLL